MSIITLSACCENLSFGIDTDVVTTLPEPGKYTCIETDIYSGCAQVIDMVFGGPASTFISNYGNYGSCEECQEVCACEPCCFECKEYEITNNADETEDVFWIDCNGYSRTESLASSATIYVCACEDSVGPITMSISLLGDCTKDCDLECLNPPCECYQFSGTSGSEGATIVYTDCFDGSTLGNAQITLIVSPLSNFTFCACAGASTYLDPSPFVTFGAVTVWDSTPKTCPCEPPPPSPTPTETPTNTPTPTPSTTPIICGSGTTTGTHYYTDCCNNFIQGTAVGLIVSIDYTKPYNGVVKLNVPATTVCLTSTPTPTPTITPTITPTQTTTPTSTLTPTPTKTPNVTQTPSGVFSLKNECDVVTLFDMGVQCYPIAVPTSQTANDGILSVQVTGGTAPYSFYWEGGQRIQTLVGVPQGSYEVTVVDYYGDYTATTVCDLFAPSPTPTSTVTPTPTNTPAPLYPNLCLIYVSTTVSYGPIQFIINGSVNGKPTWTGSYDETQLNIVWSTQNLRWEIQGWTFTSGIPVSVNTSNVPDSGWSMAGGQQAQLSMTQGDCPAYLPLMSVPTTQNQTCPENLNGSITLMTNYGVPPYEYSIDGGNSYQSSNVFQGLGSSTYTVITRDSATPTQNTLSNTVVITSLGQNSNYTIGVVIDSIVNLSLGSQLASWRVNITPPLPVGTTISFTLAVNGTKIYYLPGTGTINGTTVVKKNNLNVGIAAQSSTPLVSTPRPFCSPFTLETTTTTTTYSITMGYGDVVSGTSLSDLVITNGQVGDNSCATKLEQSILINTVSPTITGGVCNSVTNNPQSQGINNHTIVQGITPTLTPTPTTTQTYNSLGLFYGINFSPIAGCQNFTGGTSPITEYFTFGFSSIDFYANPVGKTVYVDSPPFGFGALGSGYIVSSGGCRYELLSGVVQDAIPCSPGGSCI